MERLRARYRTLLREMPGARELVAQWTFSAGVLRWHVAVEDVDEPDIDIELLADAVIVRAQPLATSERLSVSLLPVPHFFARVSPQIRYEDGYLQIRYVAGGEAEAPK
jgi:hypothetical protein